MLETLPTAWLTWPWTSPSPFASWRAPEDNRFRSDERAAIRPEALASSSPTLPA